MRWDGPPVAMLPVAWHAASPHRTAPAAAGCECLSRLLLQPERILLLDAFFLVVVFHGATVDAWARAGYQDAPEHAEFACAPSNPDARARPLFI